MFGLKKLEAIKCVSPDGEEFVLRRTETGLYCCPVCGSIEFGEAPYSIDGLPSYQMCSCGFEFGYDDSPLASSDALVGYESNWQRWRESLVKRVASDFRDLKALESNLSNIDMVLAFDLIPVKLVK
jgi:hypothetical protein